MNCEIYVKANLNPTEDVDKIIKAISNVFKYDEIELGDDYICATGDIESIKFLRDELRERKIRGAARKIMLKGLSTRNISFNLSKQAALVGTPNLVDDSLCALGEIEFKIKTDDPQKFIDWIAPEIK
ncbi:RNA-binding domain-containing protein [Methanobacterium sp. ACI-7]|uniref:RNA-binding domain-containing protein n=1 Tax=unclassified Methanobacterium TaxID=2627676 RepID=UPI0039C14B0D